MKKILVFWILLDLVFIATFNVLFFILTGSKHITSVWISYGSIHFSYFMLLITPLLVRRGSRSVDYGRPLFLISSVFFFVVLVTGILFILYRLDNELITWTVYILLTATYLIFLLVNLISNEHTADSIEKHRYELQYINEASSLLNSIMRQVTDNKIRKKVEKAYDLIKCSPVRSTSKARSIEQDVFREIERLEEELRQNNLDNLSIISEKIFRLAEERNRQTKLSN